MPGTRMRLPLRRSRWRRLDRDRRFAPPSGGANPGEHGRDAGPPARALVRGIATGAARSAGAVSTEKSVLVAAVDVTADDGYAAGRSAGTALASPRPPNVGAFARRASV